ERTIRSPKKMARPFPTLPPLRCPSWMRKEPRSCVGAFSRVTISYSCPFQKGMIHDKSHPQTSQRRAREGSVVSEEFTRAVFGDVNIQFSGRLALSTSPV